MDDYKVGYITLRKPYIIPNDLRTMLSCYFTLFDPEKQIYILRVTEDSKRKLFDADLNMFLQDMIPYVEVGAITFTDQDSYFEQFRYCAKRWYFFTFDDHNKEWLRYRDYDILPKKEDKK